MQGDELSSLINKNVLNCPFKVSCLVYCTGVPCRYGKEYNFVRAKRECILILNELPESLKPGCFQILISDFHLASLQNLSRV